MIKQHVCRKHKRNCGLQRSGPSCNFKPLVQFAICNINGGVFRKLHTKSITVRQLGVVCVAHISQLCETLNLLIQQYFFSFGEENSYY